jgi:hypothetical protein
MAAIESGNSAKERLGKADTAFLSAGKSAKSKAEP